MGSVNNVKQFGNNRRTHVPYLGFPPKGSLLNPSTPLDDYITFEGESENITFENELEYITFEGE